MAVPSFLNWSHAYQEVLGIDDVQDIMDAFGTLAATVSWTNPGANQYKSPVDAAGRYIQCNFTRQSATAMTMAVVDSTGFTVGTRGMVIAATPPNSSINIHAGAYHMWIDCVVPNQSAVEFLGAFITDPYPDAVSGVYLTYYATMKGYRNSATPPATVAQDWTQGWWSNDNGTSTTGSRVLRFSNSNTPVWVSPNRGAIIGLPVWIWIQTGVTTYLNVGHLPQCLVVTNTLPFNAIVTLPIDAATTGQFRVTGTTNGDGLLLAVRV